MTGRLALGALVLLLSACRDTTQPFESQDRPRVVSVTPRRLTYSAQDDRAPTWNATGDSVYYSGYSEDLLPNAPATVLAVSRDGGIARSVLTNAQVGRNIDRWFVTAAREPNGDRIAYVDLEPLNPFWLCDDWAEARCTLESPDTGGSAALETVRLVAATVRVRRPSDEGAIELDPRIQLDMRSTSDTLIGGREAYVVHYLPYQQEYNETRAYPFRPTWSPDGTRVAVSDGRRLMVWQPESGVVDSIPDSLDGMSPAWSPDGSRIAYMLIARQESVPDLCIWGFEDPDWTGPPPRPFLPRCYEQRWTYRTATPRIVVIAPDGSDRVEIGDGREPAWLPDGRIVYAAASAFPAEPLRIVDPESGEITTLAGTEGAREPAVSPDGSWIAYSRWIGLQRLSPRDIFVVRLDS